MTQGQEISINESPDSTFRVHRYADDTLRPIISLPLHPSPFAPFYPSPLLPFHTICIPTFLMLFSQQTRC